MAKPLIFKSQKVNVGTSSGTLLAENSARYMLRVDNVSANDIYLNFGTTAAVADETSVKVASGTNVLFDVAGTNKVNAIAVTGAVDVNVLEVSVLV